MNYGDNRDTYGNPDLRMIQKNTGGSAFPKTQVSVMNDGDVMGTEGDGMTLRDYFAAKWLQGWMANPNTLYIDVKGAVAKAYEVSDAMLKERAK